MFKGGTRGNAAGPRARNPTDPKGLFANGQWRCDCTPRLPAEHFKVRKEGPNQGRWFYTCQQGKNSKQRCDFFLWDEDAGPRAEAAVLANSRSEPQSGRNIPAVQEPAMRPITPPPPASSIGVASTVGTLMGDDNDDSFPGLLTGEEEEELGRCADAVSPQAVTPRKSHTEASLATPSTGKRKLSEVDEVHYPALPTPNTTGRSAVVRFADRSPTDLAVKNSDVEITPTPSRFRDALVDLPNEEELEKEVTKILQDHDVRLAANVQSALQDVLTRTSLRLQGVTKGRDVTRLQTKAKELKIVEQQHRITVLEAELEHERALVQHLRWERENGLNEG